MSIIDNAIPTNVVHLDAGISTKEVQTLQLKDDFCAHNFYLKPYFFGMTS